MEKPRAITYIKQEVIREELQKIEKQAGFITPQAVVRAASSKNSPIHQLFDWDDTRAAEKWRVWEARNLIARVSVEYIGRETSAYWNAKIQVDDQPIQAYFSTQTVMSDEMLYGQVLQTAIRELEYWKKKYQHLQELKDIVSDEKLKKVKLQKKKEG